MLEKEPAWPVLLHCCRQDEMQLFRNQICLKNSKYRVLAARAKQLAAAGLRELEGCWRDSPPSSFPSSCHKQQQQLRSLWQKGTFGGCSERGFDCHCCWCWAKQWYLRIFCAGFCNEVNVTIYRSCWDFSFQCSDACVWFFYLALTEKKEFLVEVFVVQIALLLKT